MPRMMYCWRCQMDMPMLTDEEWRLLTAHVASGRAAGAGPFGEQQLALSAYEAITGFKETNINALAHHRLSLYGPDCHACGKPLRTTRARFCAACGTLRTPAS